ncbi:hypothetical protein V6N13_089381 [Hibiscus sabdariffa]
MYVGYAPNGALVCNEFPFKASSESLSFQVRFQPLLAYVRCADKSPINVDRTRCIFYRTLQSWDVPGTRDALKEVLHANPVVRK